MTVASPRDPSTRSVISKRGWAMLQRTAPVAPDGNRRSASSHSSTPGAPARSFARASTSSGSPPAHRPSARWACSP